MNRITWLILASGAALVLCAALILAGVGLYQWAAPALAASTLQARYDPWDATFNTRGLELMALPSGQKEYQDGIYQVYGFVALGFPRDRTYHLWLNYAFERRMLTDDPVRVNERNIVVLQNNPSREYTYAVLFNHGQQIQFALISDDGSQQAFMQVVPYLAAGTGAGGCHVSVQYWDRLRVTVTGQGFVPGESIQWASDIGGKKDAGQSVVSGEGALRFGILDATGGRGNVTVIGRDCNQTAKYGY